MALADDVPAMTIDHDVDIVAHRLAQGRHHRLGVVIRGDAVQRFGRRGDQHLDGVVAARYHFQRPIHERLWVGAVLRLIHRLHVAAAEVRVHAHSVAHGAAQQLIHRLAERLAEDVPQRLLDAADRRHADHADAPEGLAIHLLIQELDARGILARSASARNPRPRRPPRASSIPARPRPSRTGRAGRSPL